MEAPAKLDPPYAIATGKTYLSRYKEFQKPIPEDMQKKSEVLKGEQESLEEMGLDDSPELRSIDRGSDRVISRTISMARDIAEIYSYPPIPLEDAEEQRLADAQLFLEVLPSNIRHITNLEYVEEYVALDEVLQRIQKDPQFKAAVERLAFHTDYEYLSRLHVHYGKNLGITELVEKLDERLRQWHEAYHQLMICAAYHGLQDPDLRHLVYEPYYIQLEKQRESRRNYSKRQKKQKQTTEDDT